MAENDTIQFSYIIATSYTYVGKRLARVSDQLSDGSITGHFSGIWFIPVPTI